jgi:hypothetical protein
MPSKITCPYCFEQIIANKIKVESDNRQLCPHCQFALPRGFDSISDCRIAIIGGRETGKGHFIATLIHRLEQDIGATFGFGLITLNDDTRNRIENEYQAPIFKDKRILRATPSAVVEPQTKQPMIFRLTTIKKRKQVILSFFDSAGEDMRSLTVMSTETKYICNADAIIFLMDPLQIQSVRELIPESNLPPMQDRARPDYIVDRLINLFEMFQKVKPGAQIKIPVAFVLSKTDELGSILDQNSILKRPGEHLGKFNLLDSKSVNTEVQTFFESWMGASIVNNIRIGFKNYNFFGVSSLGNPPDKKGKLEFVAPLRVEDPLLWILYKKRIIQGK